MSIIISNVIVEEDGTTLVIQAPGPAGPAGAGGGGGGAVDSVNGRTGAVVGLAEQSALATEITNRIAGDSALIPLTQRGAINGVATLGADLKIPGAQLPTLTQADITGLVADLAAKATTAALTALQAQTVTAVIFTNPATARPNGFALVVWLGPSEPTNALDTDLYVEYVAASGTIAGGLATELDTGQAGLMKTNIGGSRGTETDTGQAGVLVGQGTLGGTQGTETDTGQAGNLRPINIGGTQGTETDTGQAGVLVSAGGGSAITDASLAAITNAALDPITTA